MGKIISSKYIALILIPIVGFLLYFSSLSNGFVLDDNIQVTENLVIHSLKNIPQLFLGSSFGGAATLNGVYYKPVMTTVFAFIYALFGANPIQFHFFQLILHIANSLLLYFLLKHFFKKSLSIFLSLIFLVHPINSEAVLYISALQEQLFTLFGLSALLISVKKVLKLKDCFLFSFLILLSLLSKETGILYLSMTVVYGFINDRRHFAKFLSLSFLALLPYLILRFFAVGAIASKTRGFGIMRLGLLERIQNVPAIIFYYLKTLIFPKDLAVSQHWLVHSLNFVDFYLPIFIISIILVAMIVVAIRLRSKIFVFFSIWFLIGLFFHSNFLFALDGTVSDRWMYFPIIGLLGLIGVIFEKIKKEKMIVISIIIILIILSTRTFTRSLDWKSNLSISSHDVLVTKDSFALENTLGSALTDQGRYMEAIVHIKKSIALAPYHWINWNNLGVAYLNMGWKNQNQDDLTKAEKYFRKSIKNGSNFYLPYENLGLLLVDFRDPKEAENFFLQASKKIQLNHRLWFLLAVTEYELNNKEKALTAAIQAYNLNPDDALSTQFYNALVNNQKIDIEGPNL